MFVQEIDPLATRFHRVESIVFVDGKPAKIGIGIRLAITQANGTEHEQVIHVAADEEHRLRELQAEFEAVLAKDKRLGLAAASRAIWSKPSPWLAVIFPGIACPLAIAAVIIRLTMRMTMPR